MIPNDPSMSIPILMTPLQEDKVLRTVHCSHLGVERLDGVMMHITVL